MLMTSVSANCILIASPGSRVPRASQREERKGRERERERERKISRGLSATRLSRRWGTSYFKLKVQHARNAPSDQQGIPLVGIQFVRGWAVFKRNDNDFGLGIQLFGIIASIIASITAARTARMREMQKILDDRGKGWWRKRFTTTTTPPPSFPLVVVLPRRGNDAALQIVVCTSLIGLVSGADASCGKFRELSDHAPDWSRIIYDAACPEGV